MEKDIKPSLKKIGQYLRLKDAKFVVPEYQRAYSWDITRCDKLWEDIRNFAEGNSTSGRSSYFFGTIIISCQDGNRELVDGQQRTTTFLLLLKALLMRVNEELMNQVSGEASEALYQNLRDYRRELIETIYQVDRYDTGLRIPDRPDAASDQKIYQRGQDNTPLVTNANQEQDIHREELGKILSAGDFKEAESKVVQNSRKWNDNKYSRFFQNFKFFYNKVREDGFEAPQLNEFVGAVLNKCEVIEILSWDFDQAIEMFNSLNSDALPLTDADILSAKLYKNAWDQGTKDEFNDNWKQLLELSDKLEEEKVVTIDRLLMQRMYAERAREWVAEDKKPDETTPGVRKYFLDKKNAELIGHPNEFSASLIELAKCWEEVAKYPSVQVMMKLNDNSRIFLAEFLQRFRAEALPRTELEALTEGLLRLFAVLEVVETGYSSGLFKSFLFKESLKLVNDKVPAEEIAEDIGRHIRAKWQRENIRETLKQYERNGLVYLNEFLVAKEDGDSGFSLEGKYDIEHIMPASGKNKLQIRKDANIKNGEEFKEFVNLLGNKIVLESKINREIGNDWFSSKLHGRVDPRRETGSYGVGTSLQEERGTRAATGYQGSRFPIAQRLVQEYADLRKPYWKKADIAKATGEAAERLTQFIFGKEA